MATVQIQLRRGKNATLERKKITPAKGEPIFTKETGELKIGANETPWSELKSFKYAPGPIVKAPSGVPYQLEVSAEGNLVATKATGDNIIWRYDEDTKTLYFKGTGDMYGGYTSSTRPWPKTCETVIIGNGITSVGKYAFYNCTGLTAITIPASVTSIGNQAFSYCSSLTGVTIPDSVTSIGYEAFYGCSRLTNLTIPDSVTSIGSSAFSGCRALTSINIPDSVTSISLRTFSNCSSLTSINIPESVTSINSYAFVGCTNLTDIYLPNHETNSISGQPWGAADATVHWKETE